MPNKVGHEGARRLLTHLPLAAVLLSLMLLAAGLFSTASRWHANRTIDALMQGRDVAVDAKARPQVLLARLAFLLDHEGSSDAPAVTQAIVASGDRAAAVAALYDVGNARLRAALARIVDGKFDAATGEIVLAKDFYVRALRLDPTSWDVKYNLDVAMRLMRDFPETTTSDVDTTQRPKNLWTELPGRPRGEP